MAEEAKQLDDQMKSLIDAAIDLQYVWQYQVSSATSEVAAENYPASLPEFLSLIEDLKKWRDSTRTELSAKEYADD